MLVDVDNVERVIGNQNVIDILVLFLHVTSCASETGY
jgi:hypothetical protein